MWLTYQAFIISSALIFPTVNGTLSRFIVFDKLYILLIYIFVSNLLSRILIDFVFFLNIWLPFEPRLFYLKGNVSLIVTMYLLLVNGIVFLLRKKWYGLWIENVHSTIINHKSCHRQVKKPIYFADHQLSKKRIFHRIFFNDWVEEIIIRKDYKMLMRARKKSIIAFWLWSFNSIFFGLISLAIGYAEDAPIGMLYTINLLLINIMVIIFLMIIYHLKDFTWYSSEGRARSSIHKQKLIYTTC